MSARQGILLTIALTLEVFFLGVAAAAALGGAGAARSRVVMATCVFGALLLGGAAAGVLTAMFFVGFVALLTIEMLV